MHKQKEIADDTFKRVVTKSTSVADAARTLGLPAVYVSIRAKLLGVSTKAKQRERGGRRIPVTAEQVRNYFLSNERAITSSTLREYLIRTGIKEARCEWCGNAEWHGYPIPLELHHKNQDHDDNSEDNLMILCPTCHALITRLDKLNKEKEKKLRQKKLEEVKRVYDEIGYPAELIHGLKFNITKDKLLLLFSELGSYTQVAKALGVSDNAVKKRCQRLGILEVVKPIIRENQKRTAAKNRSVMTDARKKLLRETSRTALKVDQFDRTTLALVATHPSIYAAAQAVGARHHNIADCCKGRNKTCKGYIWRFHE